MSLAEKLQDIANKAGAASIGDLSLTEVRDHAEAKRALEDAVAFSRRTEARMAVFIRGRR